jgi:large subunit ribosomal protein L4
MVEVKKVVIKKIAPKAAVKKEAPVKKLNKFEKTVFDFAGKEVGTIELPEKVFGIKVNIALLSQAIRIYQANQHQGGSSSKTRGDVRGGGRKPWAQKGTGRARQGSIRSPQFRGGGIVFGPRPNSTQLTLPAKMKLAALKSALSSKLDDIVVVDDFKVKETKTKLVSQALKKLNLSGKTLFVLPTLEPMVQKAGGNISRLEITPYNQLNAYQVVRAGKIVFSKETVGKFTEVK